MGWLLRIVLVLLIIRALWRLLVGIVEGATEGARRKADRPRNPLVQDPICGTFVVPTRALSVGQGSHVKYFCSERCRQRYLKAS